MEGDGGIMEGDGGNILLIIIVINICNLTKKKIVA